MKKVISCIVIFLFNLPAFALDYKDFPPYLQKTLNKVIAEVNANGGIGVAGRITMSDGVHIKGSEDVMVNFCNGIDEPLWVYTDGWFLTDRALSSEYAREGGKLAVRAFKYEPNDLNITVQAGEITYVEFNAKNIF